MNMDTYHDMHEEYHQRIRIPNEFKGEGGRTENPHFRDVAGGSEIFKWTSKFSENVPPPTTIF